MPAPSVEILLVITGIVAIGISFAVEFDLPDGQPVSHGMTVFLVLSGQHATGLKVITIPGSFDKTCLQELPCPFHSSG